MSQILDPFPNDKDHKILCCYINSTSQIQVARITNIPNWYFERVVFPGQRLVFEASLSAIVEVHSGMMASAILSDTIPCTKLRLNKAAPEQVAVESQRKTNIKQASKPRENTALGKCVVSPSVTLAV